MTRTVAVGEPGDEMKKVYHTVLEAQLVGIAAAKAGVPGVDIHMAAQKVIAEENRDGKSVPASAIKLSAAGGYPVITYRCARVA